MTVAVRGIVEPFRLVKRDKHLHYQIIAISVSHGHRTARIDGDYHVIDGRNITLYFHSILAAIHDYKRSDLHAAATPLPTVFLGGQAAELTFDPTLNYEFIAAQVPTV